MQFFNSKKKINKNLINDFLCECKLSLLFSQRNTKIRSLWFWGVNLINKLNDFCCVCMLKVKFNWKEIRVFLEKKKLTCHFFQVKTMKIKIKKLTRVTSLLLLVCRRQDGRGLSVIFIMLFLLVLNSFSSPPFYSLFKNYNTRVYILSAVYMRE